MVHLYTNFYEKRYTVSCCSCVVLVWAFFAIMAIIEPFLIAHQTQGKCRHKELKDKSRFGVHIMMKCWDW